MVAGKNGPLNPAVTSVDGMTADFFHVDMEFLGLGHNCHHQRAAGRTLSVVLGENAECIAPAPATHSRGYDLGHRFDFLAKNTTPP